ncbi:MAG: hypothetical protein OXF27_07540 [Acidobacteria bacterium]|nr:hypothetical protein [Acidobacteriota bacterium]
MSDNERAVRAALGLGPVAGALSAFSGVGSGVQDIRRGRTVQVTPRTGGRGIGGVQLGRFVTHDFGVGCFSTAEHDAVLSQAAGQRVAGVYVEQPGVTGLTFEAVVQSLALAFDKSTDAVTWGAQFAVDGSPADGGAVPDVGDPQEAYRQSQCQFWYGGDDFLADLTAYVEGAVRIDHVCEVDRRRVRRDGDGLDGLTADGDTLNITVSLGLRSSDETRKLIDNPRGIFMVHRLDADEVRMVPVICAATPVTGPGRGVIAYQARLQYDSTRFAVVGDPVVAAGRVAVPDLGAGAVKTDGAIVYHSDSFDAAAGAVAVGGPAMVAEGATR